MQKLRIYDVPAPHGQRRGLGLRQCGQGGSIYRDFVRTSFLDIPLRVPQAYAVLSCRLYAIIGSKTLILIFESKNYFDHKAKKSTLTMKQTTSLEKCVIDGLALPFAIICPRPTKGTIKLKLVF